MGHMRSLREWNLRANRLPLKYEQARERGLAKFLAFLRCGGRGCLRWQRTACRLAGWLAGAGARGPPAAATRVGTVRLPCLRPQGGGGD